jgi:SAM-dependent methyltransferase
VLDVACGTAEHGRLLAEEHGFAVDGLDLDPAFVAIARRKMPNGSVFEGDMTSFAIPGAYDVIVCLFSSIGYVRTLDNVRRTLARFRAHLAEGGVMLVEPWFPPGVLEAGRVSVNTAEADGLRVVRMSHVEVEHRLSRLRFEYLVGRPSGIQHLVETHELGLFTTEEMIQCFERAGASAIHDPEGLDGRGLFIARG